MAQTNRSLFSTKTKLVPQIRNSLRTKLIIAFLLVSVLSVGVVAFITDRVGRANLTQQVGLNLKSLASSQALTIGDLIARQVDLLQSFSLSKLVQDRVEVANASYNGDQAEIEKLDKQWQAADAANDNTDPLVQARLNNEVASELREYRDTFPDNVEVFVTDQYGALVATTNRTSDYFQADEEWWQAAYNKGQGSVYISQPEFDESSATYSIIIGWPLYAHGTQRVVGVLRTTYRLAALAEVLAEGRFGQTGDADLLLPGGQLLRSEGDFVSLDSNTLAQLEASATENYAQFTYDGAPSLVSQSPINSLDPEEAAVIGNLGWRLIVDQDPNEALQPVNAVAQVTLFTSLGVLLLVGVLALGAAQLLTRPIIRLTSVAQQVADGDLTVQAQITSTDEIGTLAHAFNTMTGRLRENIDVLGERVTEQTRQLRTVMEISQRLTTILDLSNLLHEVVIITKETFNYYHTHIYLLDERGQALNLAEGYGEPGAEMKRTGHNIALTTPRSLVARAAREGKVITVENVRLDPDWLPNPLLPETHSEMAVPIMLGREVVGVLDVQSETVGGLMAEDETAMQALANQVAVAVHNARLFSETQTALGEAQNLQRLYTGQVWERFSEVRATTDYEFRQSLVPPLQDVVTPEATAALQREQTVVLGSPAIELKPENLDQQAPIASIAQTSNPSALATPLKLHNKVIGVLGLHDENTNRRWTEDEIALIEAVSEQMSQAIEQARLFDETQRSAWRDQMVSESTAKVWSSSEIEEVMRAAVAQLGDKLRASEVVIRLGTEAELVQE